MDGSTGINLLSMRRAITANLSQISAGVCRVPIGLSLNHHSSALSVSRVAGAVHMYGTIKLRWGEGEVVDLHYKK